MYSADVCIELKECLSSSQELANTPGSVMVRQRIYFDVSITFEFRVMVLVSIVILNERSVRLSLVHNTQATYKYLY